MYLPLQLGPFVEHRQDLVARLRHQAGVDPGRAEIAEAPGMGGGLGEAEIETAQQRADGARKAAPA